jgi:hypothetical protein
MESMKPLSVILFGQKIHPSGCLEYGDLYKKIHWKILKGPSTICNENRILQLEILSQK